MPGSSRRTAPGVFLSYSHDSEGHRAAVLGLAQRLRAAGIEARVDRYVTSPPGGWPRWMLEQVEAADFVLAVCTPTYRRRIEGKEQPGKGLGATFEGLIALQVLYESGAANHKIVPVHFADVAADEAIPLFLRPFTRFCLPPEFDALVEHLCGRPAVEPAPLGAARTAPRHASEPESPAGERGRGRAGASAGGGESRAGVSIVREGGVFMPGGTIGGAVAGRDLILGNTPRRRSTRS